MVLVTMQSTSTSSMSKYTSISQGEAVKMVAVFNKDAALLPIPIGFYFMTLNAL